MSSPAIDFSVMTRQISNSMENAMSHMTETIQMDMNMLEKRRIEVMNEMELTQLNDFMQGRNEEVTLESIKQFEDKWTDKMIEKNGRLTGRDLLDIKREKQAVETIIQRNNATLEQVRAAQGLLRSPQGGTYDGDYTRKALQEYIKTGKPPSIDTLGVSSENPWLRIQPVDVEDFLRSQKRPDQISSDTVQISTDGGPTFQTTSKYATDEDRAAFITSQMRNPQFALGVQEKYYNLSENELSRIKEDAAAEGVNPLLYYAISFKDRLWRDRVVTEIDKPSVRAANRPPTATRRSDEPVDLTGRAPQNMEYHGESVRGIDLLPENRRVSRTLTNVRNLDTGEIESPGPTKGVIASYSSDTGKIYVKADVEDYEKPLIEDGEQIYEARQIGGVGAPIRGTKEDVEKAIEEAGKDVTKRGLFGLGREKVTAKGVRYEEPKPVKEKVRKAEIFYELDARSYPDLLEGFVLPQATTRRSLY